MKLVIETFDITKLESDIFKVIEMNSLKFNISVGFQLDNNSRKFLMGFQVSTVAPYGQYVVVTFDKRKFCKELVKETGRPYFWLLSIDNLHLYKDDSFGKSIAETIKSSLCRVAVEHDILMYKSHPLVLSINENGSYDTLIDSSREFKHLEI